jgi:hypothetical protein
MDIHVLNIDGYKKIVTCVFHIPVPVSTNQAGKTWPEAILLELGSTASVLSTISAPELIAVQSGNLLEIISSVVFSSSSLTNSQRLQEIRDRYTIVKAEVITKKQDELLFMGYEMDAV